MTQNNHRKYKYSLFGRLVQELEPINPISINLNGINSFDIQTFQLMNNLLERIKFVYWGSTVLYIKVCYIEVTLYIK